MDPKKPTKGTAAAAPTEDAASKEDVSQKETPPPDPLEQMRSDQQVLITALGEGSDASQALDRCLSHLDMIDRLILPALEKAGVPEPELRRTMVWHDLARVLLADLRMGQQDGEDRKAEQAVLTQLMTALGRQEAAADSGIFALAATAKADLAEIAPKIKARKDAPQEQAETLQPRTPALNILRLDMFGRQYEIPSEDYPMARNQNDRPRDDDGRFTSGSSGGRSSGRYDRDDDRSSGSGWHGDPRGHAEASRLGWEHRDDRSHGGGRDDDGRRYGRGNGGSDRSRDDQGRFASDDDRRGSRSSRYEDDDDRRYSSRGRDDDDDRGRGWYGDPRGHAEASRLGWEHRRDNDDDDRGYSSRGRSSGNDRSRDDQGRFTSDDDDRGYSSRGRSSGNDRPRDDQGRFASDDGRRGSRSSRDDDDRRYSSRGRDDDDDDRRGHGGWFGDPRGHAEASRRGWENRR
ncbi:hypothetical protein [Niveispirillum sp. KHB5.9]|uniref:hypothetical protein n=1 Tax=Niveispirillum sp. KHB5.9 TaxID=3400269 RepID=UPI003A847A2D